MNASPRLTEEDFSGGEHIIKNLYSCAVQVAASRKTGLVQEEAGGTRHLAMQPYAVVLLNWPFVQELQAGGVCSGQTAFANCDDNY